MSLDQIQRECRFAADDMAHRRAGKYPFELQPTKYVHLPQSYLATGRRGYEKAKRAKREDVDEETAEKRANGYVVSCILNFEFMFDPCYLCLTRATDG